MAVKKVAESFSRSLAEEVQRWGSRKQTGVSLRNMMEFGSRPTEKNLLISAQFLHKELPIRIARRAIELENLPFGLSYKPAVLKVRDWYLDSFRDVRFFPEIKDNGDELAFTQIIKMIKVRHNNVVPAMALGVQQLKKDLDPNIVPKDLHEIHQFLDRFYLSRIGIRMLIGQHVALHDPDPEPGCVGQINTRISPMQVAQIASEDARSICFREYGTAPEFNIYGDPNFTFPYVPSHLHLMVFELVKNSLRAVQEHFMDSDKDVPPIRIIVADGIEDVTIKISDEGGGIPRSGLSKIFTYLYSTAKNPPNENYEGVSEGVTMAGYGYGIPISRLYARYFGGDLQIISMEGYGGAAKDRPGPAGGGEVVRDQEGNLIIAFYRFHGSTMAYNAELMALKEGLEICSDLGLVKIWLELDSTGICQQIIGGSCPNWVAFPTISCIRYLLSKMEWRFSHIYREGNKAADSMANLVIQEKNSEMKLFNPRGSLLSGILRLDKLGLPNLRIPHRG